MRWYTIEGPECCGKTSALSFLDRLLCEAGVNVGRLGGPSPKGLQRMVNESDVILMDDIDMEAKRRYVRKLNRDYGDVRTMVVASARSVPSNLTQYETLWVMPAPISQW